MREFDIKRQGRRLGIAALLFLVLIGAGSLISLPVDGERVGRLLRPTLSAFFGADVTLDLTASLSILPRPTLEINGLTISKKDKILIKASSANAPVSLIGLLSGRLSASSLTITEPVITLPSSGIPDTRQSALSLFGGLIGASDNNQIRSLDTVTIRAGRIMIAGDIPITVVEKIDADLSITQTGRLALDLKAPWKSETIDLTTRLDPLDPRSGNRAATLAIKSGPASVNLEGVLTSSPEIHFAGRPTLQLRRSIA